MKRLSIKRRYKVLIAIIVPVLFVAILKYTHEASYKWLTGYMFAMALVFKSSIVSLWLASQLHAIAFLKSLTLFQSIFLIIKRWLLDSVLANWIQTHIIENFMEALKEGKDFYLRQDLKSKFKNIFLFLFSISFSGWVLYITGFLDNIVVFAELRLFIAGVFTAIVTFIAKMASWTLSVFAVTWLGPIIEVFALSYILLRLETWFGPNNFLSRFFRYAGEKINLLLNYLGILKDTHLDPLILEPMVNRSKEMGTQLSALIREKKIREEYRHSENFENIIMKAHIEAYRSFNEMNQITDKKTLYILINQKTGNNLDIVAYVSRSVSGVLVEEPSSRNYHDVFLLESYASHKEHGVKVYDEPQDDKHINQKDFWVLNTNNHPVTIRSNTHNFENMEVPGHGLKLIKVTNPFCYKFGDVFCEYRDKRVSVTAIERG